MLHTISVPSVLQLLGPSSGGIRLHVAELADRLPALGWDTSVMGPPRVMDGLLEGRAGAPHEVVVPPFWKLPAFRPAAERVRQVARHHDVLHVHGLKAMRVASLIDDRPPTVLTVHNLVGGTQPRPLRPLLARLERAVVRDVDHLVVINDEMRERFADVVPPERTSFVLPASPRRTVGRSREEVRAGYGVADDAPLVVVVARHHRQKNLRMFLDAMAQVRRSVPEVRAVMVGDGPERAAIERHRDALGLRDVVVIAGQRPNPADEMHAADVVALSSDWEGSPLVVAECLQLGRPLVCTAVGTVTSLLTDGEHARITPVGDAGRFADALVEVLHDRQLAHRLGEHGAELAATIFEPGRLVAQVAEVYARVLTG